MGEGLALRLLAVEARAARLEGAFDADPELGAMWRAGAALSEACRSVGLEDIRVLEGDVIHRHLENRATEAELARGVEAAAGLLREIARPGRLRGDPEGVIARCWRAAVRVDEGAGPPDVPALAARLRRVLDDAPSPILGAMRAAATMRAATGSAAPSAERLIFMAAEHAPRAGRGSPALGRDAAPPESLGRVRADWIALPSCALSEGVFRAWSPGTPGGLDDLLRGLTASLDRAVGQLPLLRRWRDEARAAAGARRAKSRLRDLVELLVGTPIVTPALSATGSGCRGGSRSPSSARRKRRGSSRWLRRGPPGGSGLGRTWPSDRPCARPDGPRAGTRGPKGRNRSIRSVQARRPCVRRSTRTSGRRGRRRLWPPSTG